MRAGHIVTRNQEEEIAAMREIVEAVAKGATIPGPAGTAAKILKPDVILQAQVLMRPLTRKFTVMIDVEDKTISDEKMATAIYEAISFTMNNDIDGAECLTSHDCGQVSVEPAT